MKMLWLTDIHLNFLDKEQRLLFYQDIVKMKGDGLLISGDIAEADSIATILQEMCQAVKKPIYFVLGNHDYYRSHVDGVHVQMKQLMQAEPLLHWWSACGIIAINTGVVLVGQDGWADGRLGSYHHSSVALNDSRMIADLFQKKILGKNYLLEKMQQLADEDTKQLSDKLQQAIKQQPNKVIVVTHVPPFKETCLYEGKISSDDYLPFFGSKAMGDVLMAVAQESPNTQFLVLCGHTHHECVYQPMDNLCVRVGGVDYFQPKVQDVIHL